MLEEGVRQYKLSFTPSGRIDFKERELLDSWRLRLQEAGLLGRDPKRYGGLAYGNISIRRSKAPENSFIVTGSQTSDWAPDERDVYAEVNAANILTNSLSARGAIEPSSEALTHAAIYQALERVGAVIHVHSPKIWESSNRLDIKCTPESLHAGTDALAVSIYETLQENPKIPGTLRLAGHEHGFISWGADIQSAGEEIFGLLKAA